MALNDHGDTIGPMGYWADPFDSPTVTVERDAYLLKAMQDATPEFFTARAAREPKDTKLYAKMVERMKADGYGDGSMDLRYVMLPIYGTIYEWAAQIIGSCVASGGFRATVLRILCEIVLLGDLEEMLGTEFTGPDNIAPFAPYAYRAGRKFAGINGNGDGSMCGPHVKGMQEYGILKCSASGLDDYTDGYPECSGGTYRKWGANDRWLEEFAEQGRAIRLKESERVETASRSVELIRDHFKPQMICSGVGLAPAKKHRDGFWIYKASGSWSHNMSLVAVRVASDGQVFVGVLNSWGAKAHRDGSIMWVPIELLEWWIKRANVQSIGEIDLLDSEVAA